MLRRKVIILLAICFSFIQGALSFGQTPDNGKKNILFLNSYHQGFLWSDSVTNGFFHELRYHPEYTLYVENLQSKQFGQSQFEIVNQYLTQKYSGITIHGLMVSDNDALDFAFRYKETLFPNIPVVFSGISNPEDYPLEDSEFYGFKETAPTDSVLSLIRKVLPNSRKILILTDNTTTGKIYRNSFNSQQSNFKDLEVIIPEVIDVDTILYMSSSGNKFDAIYYIGIGQDKDGNLVDYSIFFEKIRRTAKVPLFGNHPQFIGKGILGGLYQSGRVQGVESAKLLIRLLNTNNRESVNRINETDLITFFDLIELERFGISTKRLPKGAIIVNQRSIFNKANFGILIGILIVLILLIVFLWLTNRKRKKKQQQSESQLRKIESQKNQLEEASRKLNTLILELGESNNKLNETNAHLLIAKKKAEESDNLKSAFLANVSHEIRTPLNSIVGFSSLLGDDDLSEETRNSYIDLIESNTESLLVLIDEILDLSKIESQQLTLKMQDFSIDELISELYKIFSHDNRNLKVELKVSQPIEGKSLFINSDRVRVKQIFINLLSNAFKFTDSGSIEMGYFISENVEIVIYVKDTGIGIKKEYHQSIFNRFEKLNENSSRIYRGTGLGLAITHKLVELLGGRIWIESEQGKGSTFFFTLKNCELKQIPD